MRVVGFAVLAGMFLILVAGALVALLGDREDDE